MRVLPLLTIIGVLLGVAAPAQAAPPAYPASAPAQHVPSHYRDHEPAAPPHQNPLALVLPDGGTAQSCADPMAIHGHRPDTNWYLYCTSDALTNAPGPDGHPVIHNVPMYRSTDLFNWKYQGDAFPTKPAWVGDAPGIWAPDVVYRNNRYYLYYAASDSALPGGGSAVGVATSSSPVGPWTDSGRPVVAPRDAVNGGGRRWEFDPEVITAGSHTYVYFGSYFGGIFARKLSADGLTSVPATETRIAIDNRYEGTTIVHHDGWYYFMGSSTNCCNGSLTGYSVFAARSRSPLGPFLDRDGRSILTGRVGGTPVITQNGNRWVGAGHNTVITDFAGQDWTIYHAVDRNNPYYAGQIGYTKRPSLIDPLDWQHGWPVVLGGSGPSAARTAGPVAQPGERATYHPSFVRAPAPARAIVRRSDDFAGSGLSSRWTWVRPPAANGPVVSGGALHWQTQPADLHPENVGSALASVLTEPAPRGDYLVETKVAVDVPAEGCCQNYVQGGLVVYGDDGNYVKLASVSIFNTRQTEFGKEVTPVPAGYSHYGNSVGGPVGDSTYLRIVHHRVTGSDAYTGYTSVDGKNWDDAGTWTADLGAHPRIGLVSMGGAGFTSTFAYVKVSKVFRCSAFGDL